MTGALKIRERHVAALDGVRGIAVCWVMLHHFTQGWSPGAGVAQTVLHNVAHRGWAGVDLFFVLSGFLITSILLESAHDQRPLAAFYMRRVVRIWPLYLLALVVLFYALPALDLAVPDVPEARRFWYWLHCANIDIALHGWPGRGAAHFWSLAVEEHFYLVWPLVVFAAPKRIGWICGAIIVSTASARAYLAYTGVDDIPLFVLTPTRVDSLAAGGLIASLGQSAGGLAAHRRVLWPMVLVPFALLFWQEWVESRTLPFAYVFGTQFAWMALFFAGLIGLVVGGGKRTLAARALCAPWLRALGKYSYGMYVWHLILDEVFTRIFPHGRFGAGTDWPFLSTLLSIAERGALTFVLAYLSYHLVERWFLELKRLVPYRRKPRAT